MKNSKLITLSFRKIKGSFKRFFSLIILSLLGVSFFVGMKIAMPNLLMSLDEYYKNSNVYDVEIISTNGLNEDDISAISKLDKNINVYGLHFKDVLFNDKNLDSAVIRINELNNNINKISLVDGRLPTNKNEIVIDEKYLLSENGKIGDKLELVLEKDDNEITEKELVIVGVVNSPVYLSTGEGNLDRGTTLVGNGAIKYYAYGLKDIFNMDYYTQIYIDYEKANINTTNTDSYNKKIKKIIKKIESIKDERVHIRYKEIKEIALARIKKEEDKLNQEIINSKNMLEGAKTELDNLKNNLDQKTIELNNAKYRLDSKKNEIDTIESQIKNGESGLTEQKKRLDDTRNSIDNYDNLLRVANKNRNNTLTKNDIISILPNDSERESTIQILNMAEAYGVDFSSLGIIKKQIIDRGIDPKGEAIAKINTLEQNLNNVLAINNGYALYESKLNELNIYKGELERGKAIYNSYLNTYNNGNSLLNTARDEYNANLNKYNSASTELLEKERIVNEEIQKARDKVDKTIVPGTWLIQNRMDNIDYSGFINSIESLKNLSVIFPIIFFVVSIFISLLVMTRMGIENRSEMGTLKAFGFSKKEILVPYILYSLLATLIGSILGVLIGTLVLPKAIFNVYTNLYAIPKMIYSDFIHIIILGVLISVLCIVGSTIISIMGILKQSTISLLRPIAPAIGNKILLEKFPSIWNKISFANKITLRNIFRYKKRIFMTLVGIISCTIILISAFLIRDSITTVLDVQFNELFKYDSMIYLDGSKLSYELDDIFSSKHIKKSFYADLEKVKVGDNAVNIIVPQKNNDLEGIIELKNENEKLKIKDNGVIITSKLAKMFNIKKNGYIKVKMTDNAEYKLKVNDITENYIGNYIYMSKKLYQDKIGLHKLNVAFLKLDDAKNEDKLVTDLLAKNSNILSYLSIQNSVANVRNMFTSLNNVVIIAVVFSLLLAIVVLYSLAYIVISERQREIATLKVLGFDDEEVDMYLLKEQSIIVLIGIIAGLIIGIIYALFLVDTLEINIVQFNKFLLLRNFLICMILMITFTSLVGQLIHFRLRKINMIESLKSVE